VSAGPPLLCIVWVTSSAVILTIRTWAMWYRTPRITFFLFCFALVSSVFVLEPRLEYSYIPQVAVIPIIVVVVKDMTTRSSKSPETFTLLHHPHEHHPVSQTLPPQLQHYKQCQIVVSVVKNAWIIPYISAIYFESGELSAVWYLSSTKFINRIRQWHWVFRLSWSHDSVRAFPNPSDSICWIYYGMTVRFMP